MVPWQEIVVDAPRQIFQVTARPVGNNGDLAGWVVVLREVTQERARQAQMQAQDRLATVGQLAAGIAHDFNNVLTPILIYTDMAVAALPEQSRMRLNLEEVLQEIGHAKDLVVQLLAFSRQDPQKGLKPTRLQPMVKETFKLLRAVLPTTIQMREHIDPEAGSVLADPTQIHQVLMNLCINAQYAMRETGGVLEVSLEAVAVDEELAATHPDLQPGAYVRLGVCDNGAGMDAATLAHIFEPFYTTKPIGEGTGMGLAVTHGIVTRHGGALTVDSRPGEGATFHIYLPLAANSVAPGESNAIQPAPGTGRILVVDDEAAIALSIQQILEGLGYTVTPENDSGEALETFRTQPDRFDLVISDLIMPRMTGTELAGELLRLRPDLPIILITGLNHTTTAEAVGQLGIRAYLSKPFTISELSQTVRRVLEQSLSAV